MIKVGVIGAGHLGKWHIQNLKEIDTVDLVGFHDQDSVRSQKIAQEYGVQSYDDLNALLSDCEAVSIVVPTSAHYAIARTALRKNCHVFCEKPFMETLDEADAIIKLARENDLVLQVGHIERFNPALAGIRNLSIQPLFIESHRIAPFNPRGTDVAVILDLMIHDIDIILSVVQSPVASIDAAGAPVLTENVDIANARIRFQNGCVANITASRISAKQMRKIRIFQKDAYISIDFLKNKTEVYSLSSQTGSDPKGKTIAQFETGAGEKKKIAYRRLKSTQHNAMREELYAFSKAIENGTKPPVTGEDGKRALEIALQIEQQIRGELQKRFQDPTSS